MSASESRTTAISENEQFWLDVIRSASGFTDPAPTLARAQKLRLLFIDRAPSGQSQTGAA